MKRVAEGLAPRVWLGLVLGLLILSACEQRRIEIKVLSDQPPAATVQGGPEAAVPKTNTQAGPATAKKAPAAAALPPASETIVDDDPEALMGLDRDSLVGRLGRPALVRLEDPAEVWQYRGEACVFDLFFYPDNGSRAVVYLEARDLAAQPIEARPCLRGLLEARAAKPLG